MGLDFLWNCLVGRVFNKWKCVIKFSKSAMEGPPYYSEPKSISLLVLFFLQLMAMILSPMLYIL